MKTLLFFIGILPLFAVAQQNNVWCFGDSAGIDFNGSIPAPITTSLDTRGSCVSLCDTGGTLLFYANTRATINGNTSLVWNKNNVLMQNGSNIVGEGWYHELCIVPEPDIDSSYYLFCLGETGSSLTGLYYSKIDLKQNSGLGVVTQKNIQLMSTKQVDCISAVKHGNGRDWWVVGRKFTQPIFNNEFWICLVSPTGVSSPTFQNIGSINETNNGKISFSPTGDALLFSNIGDLLEMYDFDRCTGVLSNVHTIQPQGNGYFEWQWGTEFSPNGQFIYASTSKDTTRLYQYNLNDPNPAASRVKLFESPFPEYSGGDLKRGPDGKIYFSIGYNNGVQFPYPYPDSVYNNYNMYLSVINQPDSLDTLCDFQPYSFYLGGKRTYLGLPNNPDYDIPRDSGSVCDRIQWTGSPPAPEGGEGSKLFVTYITSWQKLFVNAQGIKGKNAVVKIYDLNGRVVFKSSSGSGSGGYFTQDVDVSGLSSGMYVVQLITEKEMLVKKFIKQ